MTLFQVIHEIVTRLENIFMRDEEGKRPVYGGTEKFQTDPHWRDLVLFSEYFNGDNGAGLGASHQTGWTGADRDSLLHLDARDHGRKKLWNTADSVPCRKRRHRQVMRFPTVKLLDFHIAVAGVDGQRGAAAIQLSAQPMAVSPAALVMVRS